MLPVAPIAAAAIRAKRIVSPAGLVAILSASALMLAAGPLVPALPAQTAAEVPGPAPSAWIISTRNAPLCGGCLAGEESLDYWHMEDNQNGCPDWRQSDCGQFHAENESTGPICFYIHGNRMDHCHAIREGLQVLDCLHRQAEGRKFRLVIWSWPSRRIKGGNRRDVRVKAARSDVQAYYLARCLRRMNPETRVGLIGYSFGARVIAGALEILAGGQVAGYRLQQNNAEAAGTAAEAAGRDAAVRGSDKSEKNSSAADELSHLRIVMVAAATDRCWLLPGRRHGSALEVVERALITCNPCDPVLKHYPKMYGCRGPQAAGYTGPALNWQQREKTEVLNLGCSVGKSHRWNSYLFSPCLYWRLGECIFDD